MGNRDKRGREKKKPKKHGKEKSRREIPVAANKPAVASAHQPANRGFTESA